jgi:hypothetical protein
VPIVDERPVAAIGRLQGELVIFLCHLIATRIKIIRFVGAARYTTKREQATDPDQTYQLQTRMSALLGYHFIKGRRIGVGRQ